MASDKSHDPDAIAAGAPTRSADMAATAPDVEPTTGDVEVKTWLDSMKDYEAAGVIAAIGLQLAVLVAMIVMGSLKAAREFF